MPSSQRPRGKRVTARPDPARTADSERPVSGIFRDLPGTKLSLILLLAITALAYINAWPDALILDDQVFVGDGRFAALDLTDFVRFFSQDLWAASGADSSLYRPLLLVSIALQSMAFGDWWAGYHLANIVLHVLATWLVFGLLRQLLLAAGAGADSARYPALLAALVFGVHPIHAEVVNSIFNQSEMLVCIGVAGGTWWFLRTQPIRPVSAWLGLNLIYLLVLLCRESGAALPTLVVAILWLTRPEPWLQRVRLCAPALSLLLPLGIYLLLRQHALAATVLVDGAAGALPGSSGQVVGLERFGMAFQVGRLLPAVSLWLESLKILLWPHPLQIYYDRGEYPAWLALGAQLLLAALALLAHRRQRPGLLLGLAFFYLAMAPSSRIIGESSSLPMLSDRLLYLPSVGLGIVLAFALRWLVARVDLRMAVAVAVLLCALLAPLTWARNAEWASDTRLFEADYRRLHNKSPILNTLLAAQLAAHNTARAVELCDAHADRVQSGAPMGIHCGSAYGRAGRWEDAEQALISASTGVDAAVRSFAHMNLAMLYVHRDRQNAAREQFELALASQRKLFLREYFTAVMLLQLHPDDPAKWHAAREHLERAHSLQPDHADTRTELNRLEQKLNSH